jgi:2-oxoglutarate dehydrogenase E2 component (dihydrolipoamide succinyltransferase)
MIELKVPTVGESIQEVQISKWLKAEGDWIAAGQELVELETEKASVQVPSPVSGILTKILKQKEEFASIGEIIAQLEPSEKPASSTPTAAAPSSPAASSSSPKGSVSTPAPAPATNAATRVMPAAQRALDDSKLSAADVAASGPGGRLLKEDVARHLANQPAGRTATTGTLTQGTLEIPAPPAPTGMQKSDSSRMEQVKPMSMIRRTIAARLVNAQHTAALLTTFNEVDMQPIMNVRNKYRDAFQEKHGVKLGFMSFFAKASCEALKRFPAVNAEVRGNNVVYREYYDIGIAIGGGKGLVVPVLRNVERMGFAEVERTIGDFAKKATENKLQPEDLEGGTFTISNGGIYGSMLSTPIVNPPQSAILGLHAIQDRPVAVNGEVVIRPIMYLALTYDHRVIDGREAVTFLKTIKDIVEDPTRLFLEV